MKNQLLLLLPLLTLVFIFSCGKRTADPVFTDIGHDYFPLEVGKYIEYEIDSTIYFNDNGSTASKTSNWLVREELVDTLLDNQNELIYVLHRSARLNDTLPWNVKDVWYAKNNETTAERIEENLRFINLIFPPEKGLLWDGNVHIDPGLIITVAEESIEMFKNWEYEYLDVNVGNTINGISFDSTLHVQQADDENLIERRFSEEIYAKGVGLVYKRQLILDTQCIVPCTGQTWEQKAEKGYISEMKVTGYN